MTAYDQSMPRRDVMGDRLANVFRGHLERLRPDVVWVRSWEGERGRCPVAAPLPGDIDGWFVCPDDVDAIREVPTAA